MSNKPSGVYVISLFNLIAGVALVATLIFVAYSVTQNLSGGGPAAESVLKTILFSGIGAVLIGLLFLDASFATYKLKHRALWENTFIAVFALLVCLGFLFVDFTVPASVYTGGVKPLLNLPLHITVGIYALWNMYYLRKPTIRNLFIS